MNYITNDTVGEDTYLSMSNGGTHVFISLLSLAGSYLAKRENDICLITCIAASDQIIIGIGCIGFDISELPFSDDPEEFQCDKGFLINSSKRVMSKKDWTNLGYNPNYELASNNQNTFIELVNSYSFEHRKKFDPDDFLLLPEELGKKCHKHGVYLHAAGCVVCNDNE